MSDAAHGACLCGAVTFAVDPPYRWFANCHCSMCRKQHGTLYSSGLGVERTQFTLERGAGSIVHYRASDAFERPFCRRCGSKVPGESHLPDVLVVPAGSLDAEFAMKPRAHIFVGSKSSLCTITDALPQFDAYPSGVELPVIERPVPKARRGTIVGSCLCGGVVFEIDGGLHRIVHCHCSLCRRSRGAPFASTLFTSPEHLRFSSGADRIRTFKLPPPRTYETDFCATCGSLVPTVVPDFNMVMIPAGAIDTRLAPLPAVHIYVGSKAVWYDLTDDAPRFDEMPPPDRFGEFFL